MHALGHVYEKREGTGNTLENNGRTGFPTAVQRTMSGQNAELSGQNQILTLSVILTGHFR
jgi:hypothetical protein